MASIFADIDFSKRERQALTGTISDLTINVNVLRSQMASIIHMIAPERRTNVDKVIIRTRLCAISTLNWKHKYFVNHREQADVPADSYILCETKASRGNDCMLYALRSMAALMVERFRGNVILVPDKFTFMCGKASEITNATVVFKDYAKVCNALDFDGHTQFFRRIARDQRE